MRPLSVRRSQSCSLPAIGVVSRSTKPSWRNSKKGKTTYPPSLYGTHSLRRTKATLIYRRTGNLRAVQLLLDHTKIESTVRYLGIEVDDALTIAEQVDV